MKKLISVLLCASIAFSALPTQENQYDYVPQERFRVVCPYEFDLCGIDVAILAYNAAGLGVVWGNTSSTLKLILTRVFITYTEATDASSPVTNQLRVCLKTSSTYFLSYTPRANAAIWETDTLTAASDFNNQGCYLGVVHNDIQCRSIGGKSGTGKVMITLEFSKNIEDMILPN